MKRKLTVEIKTVLVDDKTHVRIILQTGLTHKTLDLTYREASELQDKIQKLRKGAMRA